MQPAAQRRAVACVSVVILPSEMRRVASRSCGTKRRFTSRCRWAPGSRWRWKSCAQRRRLGVRLRCVSAASGRRRTQADATHKRSAAPRRPRCLRRESSRGRSRPLRARRYATARALPSAATPLNTHVRQCGTRTRTRAPGCGSRLRRATSSDTVGRAMRRCCCWLELAGAAEGRAAENGVRADTSSSPIDRHIERVFNFASPPPSRRVASRARLLLSVRPEGASGGPAGACRGTQCRRGRTVARLARARGMPAPRAASRPSPRPLQAGASTFLRRWAWRSRTALKAASTRARPNQTTHGGFAVP